MRKLWMVGWVDSVGSDEGVSAVWSNGGVGCQESRDVEQRSKDDPETSPDVPGKKASDCHAEGGSYDTEILARYGCRYHRGVCAGEGGLRRRWTCEVG
jgi:hypothetical protein